MKRRFKSSFLRFGENNMNYVEAGKKQVARILNKIGDVPLSQLEDYSIEDSLPMEMHYIYRFLPVLFQDESEKKYIEAIKLALDNSYFNNLYQFAYIQHHMLFMTSIYFVLLKVYGLHKDEMDKAIYYLLKDKKSEFYGEENTKSGELYFGSFAIISESDVFMLLRVIGLSDSMLGELKKLVKSRNIYAHANGRLLLTSEKLFLEEIQEYNTKISHVFNLIREDITQLYRDTITNSDFYDPEIRAYDDPDEQIIEEFIRPNSLSQIELNWLRKIKVSDFKEYDGYEYIKDLHIALCHYYTLLIQDDDNYRPIEDIYFHHKYQNKADEFVERELGISGYECVKNGGEFPVYDCPECGHDQLVYDAEANKLHCFHCFKDFDGEDLIHCSCCNTITYKNEVGLCSNCIEQKLAKD